MSFLYPAFLFGALAVAIPIVLHLMRREAAPRVPFSAVRFLRHVPVEQTRRRRLRELLLLTLRVIALLLLALAFARPYVEGGLAAGGSGVAMVAVDTSFSVSAREQFEEVRRLARAAVDGSVGDQLVGLVVFSDTADLVVEPTASRGAVLSAIDNLQPSAGGTRYGTALARAAEAIGDRDGSIVVVSDLQRSGWEPGEQSPVPARLHVAVLEVPPPLGNLSVRELGTDDDGVVVVVANTGPATRTVAVHLAVDGATVGETAVTAEPGVATEVRLAVELPETGEVAVTVDDPDGYPADDTFYAVLDPAAPTPLLIVTATGEEAEEAFYVNRALSAGGEDAAYRLGVVSASTLATRTAADLQSETVILVLSTFGLDQNARAAIVAYMRAGGGVLVAGGESVDPSVIDELFEEHALIDAEASDVQPAAPVTLAPVDVRHPIFVSLSDHTGNLGRVRFTRTMAVTDGVGEVIARFSNGRPALVDVPVGEGRALVFASDLANEWNDFPRHPLFVPYLHEAVRYLGQGRAQPLAYVVADAPAGVPRVPGIVSVGEPTRRVAINADPRESDPSRLMPDAFVAAIPRVMQDAADVAERGARQQEDAQRYWRYGLLLMLVVLATESVLGSAG